MWTGDIIGNGRRNPVKSRGTELLHHVHCAFAATLKLSIGISFTFVTTCIVCCRWIFLQNLQLTFYPSALKASNVARAGGWAAFMSAGHAEIFTDLLETRSFLAPILGQVRWLRLQLIEYAHNAFVNDYFDIPEIKFLSQPSKYLAQGKLYESFCRFLFAFSLAFPDWYR